MSVLSFFRLVCWEWINWCIYPVRISLLIWFTLTTSITVPVMTSSFRICQEMFNQGSSAYFLELLHGWPTDQLYLSLCIFCIYLWWSFVVFCRWWGGKVGLSTLHIPQSSRNDDTLRNMQNATDVSTKWTSSITWHTCTHTHARTHTRTLTQTDRQTDRQRHTHTSTLSCNFSFSDIGVAQPHAELKWKQSRPLPHHTWSILL